MHESASLSQRTDPLGVLHDAAWVVGRARSVTIAPEGVEAVGARLAAAKIVPPTWDGSLHWRGRPDATANYILVLDALNFSFWGEPRWLVQRDGRRYDGYWALAAALTAALERGVPLTDAAALSEIDARGLATILDGEGPIPLLEERAANLREVGQVLLRRYDGQFSQVIAAAGGSAIVLVRSVVADFPSFRDVAQYDGAEVRFYKRAQILAGDLFGAFGGRGLGRFHDLTHLTAFADYKVPQVLAHLGVLHYAPHLAARLERREPLEPGGAEEVEIRAATIWAVELLRREAAAGGRALAAFEIDWALWTIGQALPPGTRPYHRTRTIFY